jgi:hypothetical protein
MPNYHILLQISMDLFIRQINNADVISSVRKIKATANESLIDVYVRETTALPGTS